MIYADHAATSKLDADALAAMMPFLLEEYGNASQLYSFSRKPRQALKEARAIIASCINAEPDEIFFTSGGSESDNWAIKGMLVKDDFRLTVTSSFEHHAVLHSCHAIERLGYPVAYVAPNREGRITIEALAQTMNRNTKLVSIMMSNNEVGTIQPIQQLCEYAHQEGAYFHTDAVQSTGHISIDVKALGVDMLSASSHKFNGPKGIGFLYVRKGVPLYPFMDGGGQEFGLRAGTENVASIVGMAVALKKNCDYLEENQKHLRHLEEILLGELAEANMEFQRNGTAPQIPGNMSLSFSGIQGEVLLHRLDLKGIAVSTGSACNSDHTEISYVLQAMRIPEGAAMGTIRVSLGPENTIEEVHQIAESIVQIVRSIKRC